MTSQWDAYDHSINQLHYDLSTIPEGRIKEIFIAWHFLIDRLKKLKKTTHYDEYKLMITQLEKNEKISDKREFEIFEALKKITRFLHNEDHKTMHESTYKIFGMKNKIPNMLQCDHITKPSRFSCHSNVKRKEKGFRECEVCEVEYDLKYLKNNFGYDLK